jgi:transposase
MEGNSYEALKTPLKGTVSERVEVRVAAERRRRWSVEQKLSVVRETLEPGAVTKAVAERHGISTGLLYTWRKQMLTTAMAGFVPVQVAWKRRCRPHVSNHRLSRHKRPTRSRI